MGCSEFMLVLAIAVASTGDVFIGFIWLLHFRFCGCALSHVHAWQFNADSCALGCTEGAIVQLWASATRITVFLLLRMLVHLWILPFFLLCTVQVSTMERRLWHRTD